MYRHHSRHQRRGRDAKRVPSVHSESHSTIGIQKVHEFSVEMTRSTGTRDTATRYERGEKNLQASYPSAVAAFGSRQMVRLSVVVSLGYN